MPLRADLLNPIPGPNTGGEDLRYSAVYDKIKEALRQDDGLAQGVWQQERKLPDYPVVLKLAQDALVTKSKDLQLATWICEALLHKEKFAGLREGLIFCRSLIDTFWDALYPPVEDGDMELRAAPLDRLGSTSFAEAVKTLPLNAAGHNSYQFKESRSVGFQDQAKTPDQKKALDKMLKEAKIAPETFDKSFADTPKAFYWQSEKDLDSCLEALNALDEGCREKFGDAAPAFGKLKAVLEEVRHTIHAFLQKKPETEPDPVEPPKPEPAAEPAAEEAQPIVADMAP